VIFLLSSPNGSAANTSLIIGPLLHFFVPNISGETEEFVHMLIRKSAHFTEYGILALLGIRAFTASNGIAYKMRWVLPLAIVAVVASLDEFNQSFEPSRTSSPWDVLLDITGGAAATLVYFAVLTIWYSRRAAIPER
jgi:VanZ family protein